MAMLAVKATTVPPGPDDDRFKSLMLYLSNVLVFFFHGKHRYMNKLCDNWYSPSCRHTQSIVQVQTISDPMRHNAGKHSCLLMLSISC